MIKSLIIFNLLFNFQSGFARADEIKTLKILGRGITSSKTNESLALACVDEANCNTVRFVHFNSNNQANFIGEVIQLPKSQSERLEKKAQTLVIKDYFKRHQTAETTLRDNNRTRDTFWLIVGSALLITATSAAPVVGTAAAIWFLKVLGATGGILYLFSNQMFIDGTLSDTHLTDQDGWNWSVSPKKISAYQFKITLDQIINGSEMQSLDDRIIRDEKFYSKKDRLIRKGVIFP